MKKLHLVKIIALALLMISLFCSIDLGMNYLYNLMHEYHDGLTINSMLHGLFGIFGDSLWSLDRFFAAFEISAWITFGLVLVNVILLFVKEKE